MRGNARQAREWLAAAAIDPRACKRQWHGENETAVLACGRFWDVLSVPQELGVLALDALLCVPQAPGPALADTLARRVGFFLPPDPTGRWVGSGTRYLGRGAWLTVPPPDRAAGPLRWLVPPDGTGALFAPAAVELALQQALGRQVVPLDGPGRCPACGAPSPGPEAAASAAPADGRTSAAERSRSILAGPQAPAWSGVLKATR
ncbi:hypothetical protein AB0N17_37415 [Streptomyces sp. NPDC051133]|uniref:hypothetical protein n=1 Tax=Streptomyces sp. NPDC051133 TaxID=3155521 RepID=UPI00343E4121